MATHRITKHRRTGRSDGYWAMPLVLFLAVVQVVVFAFSWFQIQDAFAAPDEAPEKVASVSGLGMVRGRISICEDSKDPVLTILVGESPLPVRPWFLLPVAGSLAVLYAGYKRPKWRIPTVVTAGLLGTAVLGVGLAQNFGEDIRPAVVAATDRLGSDGEMAMAWHEKTGEGFFFRNSAGQRCFAMYGHSPEGMGDLAARKYQAKATVFFWVLLASYGATLGIGGANAGRMLFARKARVSEPKSDVVSPSAGDEELLWTPTTPDRPRIARPPNANSPSARPCEAPPSVGCSPSDRS